MKTVLMIISFVITGLCTATYISYKSTEDDCKAEWEEMLRGVDSIPFGLGRIGLNATLRDFGLTFTQARRNYISNCTVDNWLK